MNKLIAANISKFIGTNKAKCSVRIQINAMKILGHQFFCAIKIFHVKPKQGLYLCCEKFSLVILFFYILHCFLQPMLLHQIEALVEVGVAHVVLAVSYHAEQLEQEMQVKCSFD